MSLPAALQAKRDAHQTAASAPTLSCPEAYRAWSTWVMRCDGGGYQVKHVKELQVLPMEVREMMLCEVYARATFEALFALHFDSVDTRVDEEVRGQIEAMFSVGVFRRVHAKVDEECRKMYGHAGVLVRNQPVV